MARNFKELRDKLSPEAQGRVARHVAAVFCGCGCGEITPIASKSDARRGYKKGEHTKYLPGHVQRTQGKGSAILHQPLSVVDDHEITESRMDNIRQMRDEDAARVLDYRTVAIERATKRSFIEMGIICHEMDRRELWATLCDETGVPFHSFEHWAVTKMNVSRRSAFAAKKVIEATKGISFADLQEMPRVNATHFARLSTAVQKGMVKKAKTMSEKEFIAEVQAKHPDQHISKAPALILNLEEDTRATFDEVIEMAKWVYEVPSLGDALANVLAFFLDGDCERENYHHTTNRKAYALARKGSIR